MSRSLKPVLLLVGCFLLAGAARAATVSGLYAAATPVTDQSDAAREAGFGRDLAAVFVKLSGNPQAPQSAPLASMIARAGQWVIEFRYQNRPRTDGGGLELWAHFDEKALRAALSRAGLGVWGEERPLVLAWVLTPAGILGDDPTNPLAAALHQTAKARGLPLVLPLMDLADQRQVSAADVRLLNLPVLEAAAKRYDAQALLVGTIGAAGQGSVSSSWNLVFGGTTAPYSANGVTPPAAAGDAVGQAATLLARQLAGASQPGTGGGKLTLVVAQVTNLQAQAAVERLVTNLQGVSAAQLIGVGNDSLRFAVDYTGQPADLVRALALTGSLAQDTAPPAASPAPASSSSPSVLYFRYTP